MGLDWEYVRAPHPRRLNPRGIFAIVLSTLPFAAVEYFILITPLPSSKHNSILSGIKKLSCRRETARQDHKQQQLAWAAVPRHFLLSYGIGLAGAVLQTFVLVSDREMRWTKKAEKSEFLSPQNF